MFPTAELTIIRYNRHAKKVDPSCGNSGRVFDRGRQSWWLARQQRQVDSFWEWEFLNDYVKQM